jgi:hypothetical protein
LLCLDAAQENGLAGDDLGAQPHITGIWVGQAAGLETDGDMHATAFVQVVAALDGELAPSSNGMPFGCLTQLTTRVSPG